MKRIFIDGKAGTTGLRIYERLAERKDIELVTLPDALRKDVTAKRDVLNSVDAVFLCLPDAAAVEAVSLIENPDVVVLDTSTAHRTSCGWTYGFPELKGQAEKIAVSKRIAVPGCHASGFIALVAPLVEEGLLSSGELLTCHSVTGYSGGGKKMIAEYEGERSALFDAPRQYALTQSHKHLPEMTAMTGLLSAPLFCPIVADFYSGMATTVPLFGSQLHGSVDRVKEIYLERYASPVVSYDETLAADGFFSANTLAGSDAMKIAVKGGSERILLLAVYDNLGKGSSGAAIECLNLAIGEDITCGLTL